MAIGKTNAQVKTGGEVVFWDGTYIEQDLFNVTLNTTNYTVKGGSTFYYSTDGGTTYNQIMGTGTINLSNVYQLDFKIIKPDSSSNRFQTIFDVGTTEGGSEVCRAVIPSALTSYFEKNIGSTITVSADSYYYISIEQS